MREQAPGCSDLAGGKAKERRNLRGALGLIPQRWGVLLRVLPGSHLPVLMNYW